MIKNRNKKGYLCPQCDLKYADKSKAKECEAWCKKYKSCNLEIIKHAKNNSVEKNRTVFNAWSKSYDRKLFQFWMKKFQMPVIKESKAQPAEIKILDVSCGTGELLLELWKQGKNNLTGVDISEGMLQKAKEKLPKEIELQKAEVEHLPFADNFFDYVLSTEAFHHYPNQEKALQEMKRVVKKKGKVIVVDINFFWQGIHWLFERFEPGCVKVNSKKEIRQLFQQAGLQEIRLQRNFLFAVMTEGRK